MMKNLLVVIDDMPAGVSTYAVSLARKLGAGITAVRPRREADGLGDGSLEARLAQARGDASVTRARAGEALEAIAEQARQAGVEAEILLPDRREDPDLGQIAHFARAFDVSIVGQVEAGRAPSADDLAERLLAGSGRPVLVVPAIANVGAEIRRIVVAWDGSASAARAFGDALPLLEQAEQVAVVTVSGPHTPPMVLQGGERLARRLSRAGVSAAFKRLPSEEEVGAMLLSCVADMGADLLVAGGYGHSRMRESLFGGATRTLLTSQTLPLFLSHQGGANA